MTTKLAKTILCLAAAMSMPACTSDNPGQTGPDSPFGGNQGHSLFGQSKGQPWTILCIESAGPDAKVEIETLAELLRNSPGIHRSDVYTETTEDGVVSLYYGTYYRRTSPRTGALAMPPELVHDLKFIRRMGSQRAGAIFIGANDVFKPLPYEPHPNWALANVDHGVYTLQVAAFLPTDDFHDIRKTAVEYCKYLREQGYEAYYYHASASSMVTVGVFPESAVRTQLKDLGNMPGNSGRGQEVETDYSPEVLALQKHEPLNFNVVNGAAVGPSRLVYIPKKPILATR